MSDNKTPVVATKRISYGPDEKDQILPGTVFAPADHGIDADELRALDAVQDCTEADVALHEQQAAAREPAPAPEPAKAVPAAAPKPATAASAASTAADIG